jgi:hypothetical protein
MKIEYEILLWQLKLLPFMKKISYSLALVLSFIFISCEKEVSSKEEDQKAKNEKSILGKWMFVSLTDSDNVTTTNAAPCLADNFLELREAHTGTISQGACVETPALPQDENFNWSFKAADVVDLGGDEVKIIALNDSTLHFKRIPNSTSGATSEYHWKK